MTGVVLSWEAELEELRRREALAEQMGGEEKVARQHGRGKMDARARLAALCDDGTFREIGKIAGKGSYDEGALNLKLALDTDDAGQTLCKTAAASDANYAVLITAQGGDKYYMQVQVTSFKTMFGSVDNMKSASIDMEITTSATGVGVVEVLAP